MLADLARLFAEEGGAAVDLVVNGTAVRAIPHPEECVAGEVEGQLIYRRRYLFLEAALEARLGGEKEIEGRKWRVVSVGNPLGLIDVTFERTAA